MKITYNPAYATFGFSNSRRSYSGALSTKLWYSKRTRQVVKQAEKQARDYQGAHTAYCEIWRVTLSDDDLRSIKLEQWYKLDKLPADIVKEVIETVTTAEVAK